MGFIVEQDYWWQLLPPIFFIALSHLNSHLQFSIALYVWDNCHELGSILPLYPLEPMWWTLVEDWHTYGLMWRLWSPHISPYLHTTLAICERRGLEEVSYPMMSSASSMGVEGGDGEELHTQYTSPHLPLLWWTAVLASEISINIPRWHWFSSQLNLITILHNHSASYFFSLLVLPLSVDFHFVDLLLDKTLFHETKSFLIQKIFWIVFIYSFIPNHTPSYWISAQTLS
jgi:hypothetical protein